MSLVLQRRMRRGVACIAASALFALQGCAPQYTWVRDNTAQADYDRDMARCQDKAAAAVMDYSSGQQYRMTAQAAVITSEWITLAVNQPQLIRQCMVALGYTAQLSSAPSAANN